MTEDLRITEYAFWPTPDQPEYGLLLCEDHEGNHWTLRGDVALVEKARAANAKAIGDEPLIGADWERREGWPDEWADSDFVKNSSGEYIAMRNDGLLMRNISSEAELEPGWHLITKNEYESMIEFVPEDELDPAHRRGDSG